MSKLETNTIDTISGTNTLQVGDGNVATINLGKSGDTINIPSGATITNSGTANNFGGANTPIVRAVPSANQTVSYNSYTTIVFNTEIVDTDNAFASNTFTVPSGKGGKYFVNVQVISNDATAGALERLNIKVNGSEKGSGNYWKQNNNDHSLILSGIFDLSAGDTVLATYFTYAGGNSTIYKDSSYAGGTCIDIFKLIS